jgi:hypothetical protein
LPLLCSRILSVPALFLQGIDSGAFFVPYLAYGKNKFVNLSTEKSYVIRFPVTAEIPTELCSLVDGTFHAMKSNPAPSTGSSPPHP